MTGRDDVVGLCDGGGSISSEKKQPPGIFPGLTAQLLFSDGGYQGHERGTKPFHVDLPLLCLK